MSTPSGYFGSDLWLAIPVLKADQEDKLTATQILYEGFY